MNHELSLVDQTCVVYNRRSGNFRFAQEAAEAIEKKWPYGTVHTFPFKEIFEDPSLLKGSNVIGLGGDGTHGTMACLNYEVNQDGLYFPLDAGTGSFFPRMMGLSQKLGESTDGYVDRLIKDIGSNKFSVLDIPPGVLDTGEMDSDTQRCIFLFSAGIGVPTNGTHQSIEDRRTKTNRIQRLFHAMQTFRHLLHEAPPLEVTIGDKSLQAIDSIVVKEPFKKLRTVQLPFDGEDILCSIPYSQKDKHVAHRILIDLFMLTFHRLPIAGGVSIEPIKQGEQVLYRYPDHESRRCDTRMHIDSELQTYQGGPVTVWSSDQNTDRRFHIVKRK